MPQIDRRMAALCQHYLQFRRLRRELVNKIRNQVGRDYYLPPKHRDQNRINATANATPPPRVRIGLY